MQTRLTLKETSQHLKISRPALNAALHRLEISPIKEGRSKYLSENQINKLKKNVNKSVKRKRKQSVITHPEFTYLEDSKTDDSEMYYLREQNRSLSKQNAELIKQNENAQRLQENAQKLQLMAQQKIDTLEQRLLAETSEATLEPSEATPSPPPESVFKGFLRRVFL